MTRLTVLVIGARGFIGRRVIHQLSTAQWAHPVAASRSVEDGDVGAKVAGIRLDATDPVQLQRALATADAVVSCLAGTAADILASGRALIEAAAQRSTPPKIVWLGSMAAYGSVSGTVDEKAPLLGDLGPYSSAKAAIDMLGARFPFVVRLRPGIVYGPESPWWSDRIARLLVGRWFGDLGPAGIGTCNLVHVDDVAMAAVRALQLESAGSEAFNLGSPEPPTWNEYFSRFAHALGATPLRQVSSSRLQYELKMRGPVLKIVEKLLPRSLSLASEPPIRPWLTTLCSQQIRMDVSKAESTLGMRWQPLDTGLDQTAAWFRNGGRTR